MKYVIAALGLIAFSSPVLAASCEKNFTVSGVRIDAVFNIQAGQIADKNVIREGICNIINGA